MKWWQKRKAESDAGPSSPAVARRPEESEYDFLERLASTHLSADDASRWLRLLRPAIRLKPAAAEDLPIARLGGTPRAPADFTWPIWEGHGPLSFVGEVDLDAVTASALDPGTDLPGRGRLLAFYFDGSFDEFNGIVGTWDKESLAGARLIHVLERRSECVEHPTPYGVLEFRPQELGGHPITTFPSWEHPALSREFGVVDRYDREWMNHPVNSGPFVEALWALHDDEPRHQIGGWADPVQAPVELEVAEAALDEPYGDDLHETEAAQWSLLLQIDSDDASEMMWGDVGTLYWLQKLGTADAATLGTVSFTWQCT